MGGRRPGSGLTEAEARFVLPPAEGWSGELASDRALELRRLYRDLIERDERLRVLNEALALLEREPQFHPARVLEAEVRFLSGRYSMVVDRLAATRAAAPGYVAAEVLFGRAAEHLERWLDAFEAYWTVRDQSGAAARRVEQLRDRVLGVLASRIEAEIEDGLTEPAGRTLELMLRYAPTDARTVAAREALSSATADPLARLTLLRRLSVAPGADAEILRRRAELELEVGDAASAVRLAERLIAERPKDPGLVELLQRSQFEWRLNVLPADVAGLAQRVRITRADYAVLLYWLLPGVRYGRSSEARIATDIIDHPQREEIVRVINLGLLDVDATVHHFEPDAPVRRSAALGALLELIGRSPTAATCLDAAGGQPRSTAEICQAAEICHLLISQEECSVEKTLSGPQALEMIRRALASLGSA